MKRSLYHLIVPMFTIQTVPMQVGIVLDVVVGFDCTAMHHNFFLTVVN